MPWLLLSAVLVAAALFVIWLVWVEDTEDEPVEKAVRRLEVRHGPKWSSEPVSLPPVEAPRRSDSYDYYGTAAYDYQRSAIEAAPVVDWSYSSYSSSDSYSSSSDSYGGTSDSFSGGGGDFGGGGASGDI
jgi:uncharacterized membrane protein YgcG